jgi:hypothetical protein
MKELKKGVKTKTIFTSLNRHVLFRWILDKLNLLVVNFTLVLFPDGTCSHVSKMVAMPLFKTT